MKASIHLRPTSIPYGCGEVLILNKDGRLIRPDYVLAKPAPAGALEHNQSYQDASPSIHFF